MAKRSQGTNPFTKHSRTSSQRQALRESISRTSGLLAGVPPAQCGTIVEDISLLFSKAFLQHECKKLSIPPNMGKSDLIKSLLKEGWIIPQDADIFQDGFIDPSGQPPSSPIALSAIPSGMSLLPQSSSTTTSSSLSALLSQSSSTTSSSSSVALSSNGVGASPPPPIWDPRMYGMFEAMTRQVELNSDLLEEHAALDESKITMINMGKVLKAAQNGQYFPLLFLNDVDIGRLRCRSAPTPKVYRRPREVEEMDFHDFLLAMCKAASIYYEVGQQRLAIQTVNLMQAALVESASKTRASVMRACERVRMNSTSEMARWDSDSLNRREIRVLLDPLQQRRSRDRVSQGSMGFNPSSKRRRSPARVPAPGKMSTPERNSGVCIQWEAGKVCKFDPFCKYKHVCVACGKVDVHDPRQCELFKTVNQRKRRT